MRKYLIVASVLSLIGCSSNGIVFEQDAGFKDAVSDIVVPDVVDGGSTIVDASFDGNLSSGSFDLSSPETDPMIYLGGSVMTTPINVYVIWYGTWEDTATAPIVEDLLSHIGGSSWFQINIQYYQQAGVTFDAGPILGNRSERPIAKVKTLPRTLDAGVEAGISDASENDSSITDSGGDAGVDAPKVYVNGAVNLIKSINVTYTHGTNLADTDIKAIVTDAIANNSLPLDINGAYLVLTSKDVSETSGFCSVYCGWHTSNMISGIDIKYIFVGDPAACFDACSLQNEYSFDGINQSPNGDWSADSMASIIGHELSELSSDPDPATIPAWQDDQGAESSDKCAWTFGKPYLTKTGSVANVSIGSRDYMIQQNWHLNDGAGGHCDLHL